MTPTIKTLVFCTILLVATPVLAGGSAELLQPNRVEVASAAGKPLTANDVRACIVSAGNARTWLLQSDGPGALTLRLDIRQKHTAVIAVAYDAQGYQISYVSSSNLEYKMRNGRPRIHSSYNRWLGILMQDINACTSEYTYSR